MTEDKFDADARALYDQINAAIQGRDVTATIAMLAYLSTSLLMKYVAECPAHAGDFIRAWTVAVNEARKEGAAAVTLAHMPPASGAIN